MQMWTVIDQWPSETSLIESLRNADAGIWAKGESAQVQAAFVLEAGLRCLC